MKEKLLNLIDEMTEAEYLCMTDMKWVADRIREFAEDNANPIDPDLAEFKAWKESAAQMSRNAEYYRGLVVEIGKMFGEAAYISDDGSRQQDVLCAKVPELVSAALAPKPEAKTEEGLRQDLFRYIVECDSKEVMPTCSMVHAILSRHPATLEPLAKEDK